MPKKLIVCLMLVAVTLLVLFLNQCIELDTVLLFITAGGALATAVAAFKAIAVLNKAIEVSKKTADVQNDLMKREWLPYLSYEKMHGEMVAGLKGTYKFYLYLKNNGRCVVKYRLEKFYSELKIHYVKVCEGDKEAGIQRNQIRKEQLNLTPKPIREESQKEGVLGINSGFFQYCGTYQFELEDGSAIDMNAPCHFRIDFVVGFKDRGASEEEYPYKLKYVVDVVRDNENNRVFVEHNIIECDIEGY